MNERIQELAKQAEDHADSQGFFVTIDFASDYQDCLMEKFAELIVRESVEVMKQHSFHQRTQNAVLEHFGVK
jgi:hypothetical protein